MTDFNIYNKDSSPEASQETLGKIEGAYGFIPNLAGIMAESPAMIKSLLALAMNFGQSSLNPVEQQVVAITVSAVNGCAYCVASHSMAALKAKMDDGELAKLRAGDSLSDPKLEALRAFTAAVVEKRGWLDDAEIEAFMAAGYTKQSLLDVMTGVTMKTLTNYTNHMVKTPLNPQYEPQKWDQSQYKKTG
jgi:uncharacterized peroxidase-related enzyme